MYYILLLGLIYEVRYVMGLYKVACIIQGVSTPVCIQYMYICTYIKKLRFVTTVHIGE